MSQPREHYEALLMKAVDGVLSADERRELDAYLKDHPELAAELDDFNHIKETTDAMTARILQDARIEPPRPAAPARALIGGSFLLLLAATLLLLGFAGYHIAVDPEVPTLVKLAFALGAGGLAGLLAHVLRVRARAAGRDPYEEIDQ